MTCAFVEQVSVTIAPAVRAGAIVSITSRVASTGVLMTTSAAPWTASRRLLARRSIALRRSASRSRSRLVSKPIVSMSSVPSAAFRPRPIEAPIKPVPRIATCVIRTVPFACEGRQSAAGSLDPMVARAA